MFKKARIQLTAFYLVILIAILAVFSLLLFQYNAQHIRDNFDEDPGSQHVEEAFASRALGQIENSILIGDTIVIVIAGFLSYWLAGRTLKPIQTALDAQEQFSANASHELRTPLSVMKTDMEIFLKKHQAATTESHAIVVRSLEEVNRLHETVENLLTLARSKKSDVLMEFEEVSITKPIHVTIKKLQHLADAKHLSLIVTKHADALVLGNERLLEQLFFNLIQNAITYTNEGEISIDISAAKQVIVRIQDTGIGIDKDSITHVFEPFYKVDASHSTNAGGVGLGLAIVKEIVSKHNGSINVQSQPGKGTVVIVTLPRYLPDVS